MDFLAYKIGANIPDEMKRPANAAPDVYEQTYHLKNKATGATKVMNDNEYIVAMPEIDQVDCIDCQFHQANFWIVRDSSIEVVS